MAKQSAAQDSAVEDMSFEESLSALEAIVQSLETGKASLDDSISAYERGIALKKHCEKRLNDAKMKIEKISVQKDGSIETNAFETE